MPDRLTFSLAAEADFSCYRDDALSQKLAKGPCIYIPKFSANTIPMTLRSMPSFSRDSIPQFKHSILARAIAPDVLLILSERRRSMMRGTAIVQVAQKIDGQRSAEQIVGELEGMLAQHDSLAALQQLIDKGYVHVAAVPDQAAEQAYWELRGADGVAVLQNLKDACVAVECCGNLGVTPLMNTLTASGIAVAVNAESASESVRLLIVVVDDYLHPKLSEITARATANDLPVLLVKPTGIKPSVGPIIHPRQGSCLQCLQFWIRTNRPVETLLVRLQGEDKHCMPLALGTVGAQSVYGLVAGVVGSLCALQEDRAALAHKLLTIEPDTMETTRHAVVRRPQCPACGNPDLMRHQADRFPQLQTVDGPLRRDGGFRSVDPLQTYEKYKHLVSPVCGPIAYLHPMPRRHGGMRQVYVAGYLVCPQDLPRGNSFDKVCAGKGQSEAQARVSALCEALERYSGVYQGDEARIRGSMTSLGAAAIDFNLLQNFSDWQYANREGINRLTDDKRKQIPLPFGPHSEIDWTPAWSLVSGKRHYVPLTYCYAEAPVECGAAFGIHNPNGAAAGNCLEEAILQGLLELIERDATAIWWYNQLPTPGIDLASFGDSYFDGLVLEYAKLGWDLWVLDLTHDLQIPVCAAIARERAGARHAIGFGCHLDAKIAVQRALTEVNQLFDPSENGISPWDDEKLNDRRFLEPVSHQSTRRADALASVGGKDLKADIAHCAAMLSERGMDLLVVDKTRPDIGLSVVQVIVPGLRHFWPRLGEGRLYDVPHKLGWLVQPKNESMLNPVPLFL
jgi:bacteriocin biosynthesis cyclodehydratase domain-containing protein